MTSDRRRLVSWSAGSVLVLVGFASGWWVPMVLLLAVAHLVATVVVVGFLTWRLGGNFEKAAQSALASAGAWAGLIVVLVVCFWSGPYYGLPGQMTVGLVRMLIGAESTSMLWMVVAKVAALALYGAWSVPWIISKGSIL